MVDSFQTSELGDYIWRRYGSSPGVISWSATQSLAQRANKMSAGRSSLARDIYRRWMPEPLPSLHGPSAQLNTRAVAITGARSYAEGMGDKSEPSNPIIAEPTFSPTAMDSTRREVGRPTIEREQKPSEIHSAQKPSIKGSGGVANSGAGAHVIQRKVTSSQGAGTTGEIRRRVGPPFSPGEGVHLSQPVVGKASPRHEAPSEPVRATNKSEKGNATSQRPQSDLEGSALQRKKVSSEAVLPEGYRKVEFQRRIGPPITLSEGSAASLPIVNKTTRSVSMESESRFGRENAPDASMLQRPLSVSAKRIVQRKIASVNPETASGARSEAIQQSVESPAVSGGSVLSSLPEVKERLQLATATTDAKTSKGGVQSVMARSMEMPMVKKTDQNKRKPTESQAFLIQRQAVSERVNMPLITPSPPSALAAEQIRRETASDLNASPPTAPPAAEPPTAIAAESAPEVDAFRLADQVYEILVRRLAAERERRGY